MSEKKNGNHNGIFRYVGANMAGGTYVIGKQTVMYDGEKKCRFNFCHCRKIGFWCG